MIRVLLILWIIFYSLLIKAQDKQLPSYKFDFGSGNPAIGYIPVGAASSYNNESGFGFEEATHLTAINRKGKDPLKDDFITSDQPFFFSVKLPEGNYDVKVILGDKNGNSESTIRVECRRMMVEKINTTKGSIQTVPFTVNVRDSMIGTTGRKVRLKSREHNYLHWDNKLTIEFNGSNPKICAVEIKPADVVTVFLAGNSTVVDQAEEPYAAWGQMIPAFFQPGKIAVCNLAESGEALSSFLSERRLEKALNMMKKGDYLFIEFAHNDQKQTANGAGPFTTYTRDLKTFINEARKKEAIPVLVTSMHRRNFNSEGKIVNTLGDYPEAMRQVAKDENVALIDLNEMSKTLYESWGVAGSVKAFVHYPANSFPGQVKALNDNTHFNPYGAYEIAKCIREGIKKNVPALAAFLKKDLQPFDPASPDPVSDWNWPLSRKTALTKPDGN